MNKAVWGVLGIVIIIVLGVFFLSRNGEVAAPTVTKATETPTTESMMVTYSGSGFSPASITVKVGNTVIFKNQSGKSMWVASDPHPIHTAYSEFDAKKGAAVGESYMFTFTKAGIWKYHNHLTPSDTGTVIAQ